MSVLKNNVCSGFGNGTSPAALDAGRVVFNLVDKPKKIPDPESLVFGETKTDHMLEVHFDPVSGWSAPGIKPYGQLHIDPASSCLQYCSNVFEGLKAYIDPDGNVRLFRPEKNMQRLVKSAARVSLPTISNACSLYHAHPNIVSGGTTITCCCGHSKQYVNKPLIVVFVGMKA